MFKNTSMDIDRHCRNVYSGRERWVRWGLWRPHVSHLWMVGWSNGVEIKIIRSKQKKKLMIWWPKKWYWWSKCCYLWMRSTKKCPPLTSFCCLKFKEGVVFHNLSFVWPNLTHRTTPLKLRPGTTGANIVRWQKNHRGRTLCKDQRLQFRFWSKLRLTNFSL